MIGRKLAERRTLHSLSQLLTWFASKEGLANLLSWFKETLDSEEASTRRVKFWDNFNTCWLALLQRQLDGTKHSENQRHQVHTYISLTDLEIMRDGIVRNCNELRKYGLVDNQIRVVEEEIIASMCP